MPQAHITISQALQGFVEYMSTERRFRSKTVENYLQAVRFFVSNFGDLAISDLTLQHFISLKSRMAQRNAGESHVAGTINALKCLVLYARDILDLPVLDIARVKAPRVPTRDVSYLTPEELANFLGAIPLRTWAGKARVSGYCLRALVETLAATGMRISEALSLSRESIDYKKKEAIIVGKGNKQRTVFFTDRSLQWVTRYLDLRTDNNYALFVTRKSTALNANTVHAMFRRATKWAGLQKRVTPHIIRHTTATNLLRGGCPIGFIKQILGHSRLETTCKYYLGILGQAETKEAHQQFSRFVVPEHTATPLPTNADDPRSFLDRGYANH